MALWSARLTCCTPSCCNADPTTTPKFLHERPLAHFSHRFDQSDDVQYCLALHPSTIDYTPCKAFSNVRRKILQFHHRLSHVQTALHRWDMRIVNALHSPRADVFHNMRTPEAGTRHGLTPHGIRYGEISWHALARSLSLLQFAGAVVFSAITFLTRTRSWRLTDSTSQHQPKR